MDKGGTLERGGVTISSGCTDLYDVGRVCTSILRWMNRHRLVIGEKIRGTVHDLNFPSVYPQSDSCKAEYAARREAGMSD